MEDPSSNESELEFAEPRLRFYNRPAVRTVLLIAFVLLFLFLIGVVFDSTYFRF
jgi:hypothetical protein